MPPRSCTTSRGTRAELAAESPSPCPPPLGGPRDRSGILTPSFPMPKGILPLPQMRKTHPAAESPAHASVSMSGNVTWSRIDLTPMKRMTASVIGTSTKPLSPPHRRSPGGKSATAMPVGEHHPPWASRGPSKDGSSGSSPPPPPPPGGHPTIQAPVGHPCPPSRPET